LKGIKQKKTGKLLKKKAPGKIRPVT